MLLTPSESCDLIVEAARQASQSKDKSLFSLLLHLEEELCGETFENPAGKPKTSGGLDPRRSSLAAPSRYVE
jgi:hypothetical protein